jgi:hypothetical protein
LNFEREGCFGTLQYARDAIVVLDVVGSNPISRPRINLTGIPRPTRLRTVKAGWQAIKLGFRRITKFGDILAEEKLDKH